MTDYVDFTAVGRYYKVYLDGVFVSQHSDEREASEIVVNLLFDNPTSEVYYDHEYKVEAMLTDAGLTLAGSAEQPVNSPPTILSTPSPSFAEGTPGSYNMAQHWVDDGQSTVISNVTTIIPSGMFYDVETHLLTYDGIGPASVSTGHTLRVNDQVNDVVISDPFTIEIEEVGGPAGIVFTAHAPTAYVSRVRGAVGYAMDSAFGTCKVGEATVDVRIQRVNTLSDSISEPGSERLAMSLQVPERMVVVYDISGWRVFLSTQTVNDQDSVTYARQTAPGFGFASRGDGNDGSRMGVKGTNLLFWHFFTTFGPTSPIHGKNLGDSFGFTNSASDKLAAVNGCFAFGSDSNGDVQNPENTTFYSCIFAQSLGTNSKSQLIDKTNCNVNRSMWINSNIRQPLLSRFVLNHSNNMNVGGQTHTAVNLHGNGNDPQGLQGNITQNLSVAGAGFSDSKAYFEMANKGNDPVVEGALGWAEFLAGSVYVDGNRLIGFGPGKSEYADITGFSVPHDRSSILLPSAMPHGLNITDISSFSDIEAANLFLGNMGPRPGSALGYIEQLKTWARNAVNGSGPVGPVNVETVGEIGYATTGTAVQGYDDIASVAKDNFAEIAAFLSTNFPNNRQVIDTGPDHITYRFSVDQNTALCPLDVWLNGPVQDSVMQSGWDDSTSPPPPPPTTVPDFPHQADFLAPYGLSHMWPGQNAATRATQLADHASRNTHLYIYPYNENDYNSEPSYVAFDFYADTIAFNSRLQEVIDAGMLPVVWIFPDDAPALHNGTTAAQYKAILDGFIPGIDANVGHYVLGLELNEYMTDAEVRDVGAHLNTLTTKKIGLHYTQNNTFAIDEPWADFLVYQYGFGNTEAQMVTETQTALAIVNGTNGKVMVAGEYGRISETEAQHKALGDAAMSADPLMPTFGFGNGGSIL